MSKFRAKLINILQLNRRFAVFLRKAISKAFSPGQR